MEDYLSKDLKEYINKHLEEWNNRQKDIWLKLSSLNKVEKNDTDKMIEFSSWFDWFFETYERYPTLKEVLDMFIGDKDETETNS